MKRFFQKIFNWEKWSYDAIYLPIDIVWLWYAVKARAFWYFTPVNPTLILEVKRKCLISYLSGHIPLHCL
jgi:hypothetical protein